MVHCQKKGLRCAPCPESPCSLAAIIVSCLAQVLGSLCCASACFVAFAVLEYAQGPCRHQLAGCDVHPCTCGHRPADRVQHASGQDPPWLRLLGLCELDHPLPATLDPGHRRQLPGDRCNLWCHHHSAPCHPPGAVLRPWHLQPPDPQGWRSVAVHMTTAERYNSCLRRYLPDLHACAAL